MHLNFFLIFICLLQHSVAYDVTFKGYTLPKGAIVFPILETVLHDTEIWGDLKDLSDLREN